MTDHEKKMETLGKAFYECRMTQEAALEYAQLAAYADDLDVLVRDLQKLSKDWAVTAGRASAKIKELESEMESLEFEMAYADDPEGI